MARPERFELPTPWFVGRLTVVRYPVNQRLAVLAAYDSIMIQSQSRHTKFELVTFAARSVSLWHRDRPSLVDQARRGFRLGYPVLRQATNTAPAARHLEGYRHTD